MKIYDAVCGSGIDSHPISSQQVCKDLIQIRQSIPHNASWFKFATPKLQLDLFYPFYVVPTAAHAVPLSPPDGCLLDTSQAGDVEHRQHAPMKWIYIYIHIYIYRYKQIYIYINDQHNQFTLQVIIVAQTVCFFVELLPIHEACE